MKLRTKFAVLLLVGTVTLSLVAYGGLEAYKHQQVESERAVVAETAGVAADQLGSALFSETDRVGSYAGEMSLDDPDATRRSLDTLAARRGFQHAAVVNRSGAVVMVAGAYSEAGAERMRGSNVSDDRCVRRTLTTGDVCISDPVRADSATFGEASHYVMLTAPVFGDTGSAVAGAVVVTYPLTERSAFVALRPLETGSQSVAVTADGRTVYGDEGAANAIVATAPVAGTDWVVRVERSRAVLNATLRGLAITQAVSILLLVATAVGFAYWGTR